MLEVYKSDLFGLRIKHSKKFLTTKTLCVIIHYPITIYLSAPFFEAQWSTCYIPHCPFLVACVAHMQQPGGLCQQTEALAPSGRVNHAGRRVQNKLDPLFPEFK